MQIRIKIFESVAQILASRGDVPPIFLKIIVLGRIEAVATDHVVVRTRAHHDFVPVETTPELDCIARDEAFKAKFS